MTKSADESAPEAGRAGAGPGPSGAPGRDRPWLFRTYAGHSTAGASNALFRKNLERGQTGLSVAFDLPTQMGYDADHALARGEVGRVGVPVCHLGDMRALFDGLPLERMNTSMTINATAPWLLALYIALAEERGLARAALAGTTQNDILKEYLARGTYIFPPAPSMRLTRDVIVFTCREIPKWNPINVCSYHLQEAGATPVQELAFALANATAVLDAVKAAGQVPEAEFPEVVGRMSFFVNAGVRFVTELCKMRAFVELWDDVCRTRYGVREARYRRFRYGVQVNSLGLTEQQPENNAYRILIAMLAVVLSKDARARAVQLPAWNEALGLPRAWDQQWSLRLQQILAYESDLLEYGDIFAGSALIEAEVAELAARAREEMQAIERLGGAVAAIESGYMKERLVESNAARLAAIEAGEQVVVGVNAYTESEPSPLVHGLDASFQSVAAEVEPEQVARLEAWRAARDPGAVSAALEGLRRAAAEGSNVMEPSIACAHAGVTTGEWAGALRQVFGEYRAPTGVAAAAGPRNAAEGLDGLRARAAALAKRLGRPPRLLIGKPGLDGHSSGAEQIAVRARDAGFEVVYQGIRLTPAALVRAAQEEDVNLIGLSVLSGSHLALVSEVIAGLKQAGLAQVPVVVGGIIPPADAAALKQAGAAAVYTPKDYDVNAILAEIAAIVEQAAGHA